MTTFSKIFPPIESAFQLEPEELAPHLIEILCQLEADAGQRGRMNRQNFMNSAYFEDYCRKDLQDAFARALTAAWIWLEREGLIAPQPAHDRDWIFVTRRGHEFRDKADLRVYKASKMLPAETLDPILLSKIQSPFLRSDFEIAIFSAFKEVEIRVRIAAGLAQDELGASMMRKAFNPENGPLSDPTQIKGEQQAISDLFAGAISAFKNPSSHRDVGFNDYSEALELIMLADRLIRIAEKRIKPADK